MKRISSILGAVFLAACASEPQPPQPTAAQPARYATAEEAARLRDQAYVNFQRERERQGMVATRGSAPAEPASPARQSVAVEYAIATPESTPAPRRGRVSASEARYAMQIGKSPFELTAAERAVARGY